jgi:hypothetical protein
MAFPLKHWLIMGSHFEQGMNTIRNLTVCTSCYFAVCTYSV